MMIQLRWFALLALVTTIAASPGNGQTSNGPPSNLASPDLAIILQPGDFIRLSIWREPDLSGEFIVDSRGQVVLPKLGTRVITDVPIDSLRATIIADYQKFLANPSITVTFLRRIKVVGAVNKPGLYPVDATTTLTDVIALAGGVSPVGRSDRIDLVRKGIRTEISLNQPSPLLETPMASGDEVIVPQRGWLSRNPAIVPVAVSALVSIIGILIR